jgi:Domain of unknown function (DUF4269)
MNPEELPDFFDPRYLQRGSDIQKQGYEVIVSSGIMTSLHKHNPVLVGTLPLDIFIESSDFDILCHFTDIEEFFDDAASAMDSFPHFNIRRTELGGVESIVANFDYDGFPFEIVAQRIPVIEQVAYRHMVNEWKILKEKGDAFRRGVMELKRKGLKTEPAFARLLGLEGDAYKHLLDYMT